MMGTRRRKRPEKRYDSPRNLKDLLDMSKVLYDEYLYTKSWNVTYENMNKATRRDEDEILAAKEKEEEAWREANR
jgi:hypothetical protein